LVVVNTILHEYDNGLVQQIFIPELLLHLSIIYQIVAGSAHHTSNSHAMVVASPALFSSAPLACVHSAGVVHTAGGSAGFVAFVWGGFSSSRGFWAAARVALRAGLPIVVIPVAFSGSRVSALGWALGLRRLWRMAAVLPSVLPLGFRWVCGGFRTVRRNLVRVGGSGCRLPGFFWARSYLQLPQMPAHI